MQQIPVSAATVTVDGWRRRASEPAWAALRWSDSSIREKSTLLVFVLGAENAPPDHHIRVAWVHPDDWPMDQDPPADLVSYHRVRPRDRRFRFMKAADAPSGYVLVAPEA